MPKWDATNSNNSNRISRTFKDLDLDFGLNSVTKDVNKLTDAEAIKRSVRNLINTNNYDRPFRPEIGSGIRGLLFEPADAITKIAIKENIKNVINDYEPRVKLLSIAINDLSDQNAYRLTVKFLIKENDTDESVEILLRRLR